ncbi:MAG: preprotein translocase subunit SecA, partial [Clostridiales bacterium]|nr:preprotein translocase subunit SecA [Clostridiales bacterium]
LEELLTCKNKNFLWQKYEKKYKKIMGYPSNAIITLHSDDIEDRVYDSFENGTYRREGAKVGRNDPCPCGSGKKYKQCCG